jgi:hypothetical protein
MQSWILKSVPVLGIYCSLRIYDCGIEVRGASNHAEYGRNEDHLGTKGVIEDAF